MSHIRILLLTLILSSTVHAADPVVELGKFSVFEQLDLSKLSGGKVLAARGPAMASPRDLSVQAVYLVPAPLQKTVDLHRQWNASRHSDLKVRLHSDISGKIAAEDFGKLSSAPNNSAMKSFTSATQSFPDRSSLQLSNDEAKSFTKGQSITDFWTQILTQRAQAFASRGLSGQPGYDVGNQSIRPAEEASRLMKELGKVKAQFRTLIDQTPLGGGNGSLSPSLYWELFDTEGQSALSLGAIYSKADADSAQMLDLQYYASGGYIAFVTLYQMWPVTVDGKTATLVWRGDSLSSIALSELKGVERMGSGAAVMKELQKTATAFVKDVSK